MITYTEILNTEKIYPHLKQLTIYKERYFVSTSLDTSPTRSTSATTNQDTKQLSILRTKSTIKDIVLCNNFNLFCTFTFKNDRYDIEKCKRRMQNWLKSQQKLHGSFHYLVVPEFHKDGKAIHFHALFNNFTGTISPKISTKTGEQLRIAGRPISRFNGWQNGYSDCSPIESTEKLSRYLTKYITKDMPTFTNQARYFCSKKLNRPIRSYNVNPLDYYAHPDSQHFEYDTRRVIKIPTIKN